MSKKNVDMSVESLVDNAIDSKSKPKVSDIVSDKLLDYEGIIKREKDFKPVSIYLGLRHKRPISVSLETAVLFFSVDSSYPLSKTDQIHNLSISEQIRRGQGDLDSELDKDSFDFPDGKDDGSSSFGIFELSNRVDQWIAEQNLSSELKESFRSQVLQQQADKALKSTLDSAQQKNQSNEQSLEQKTSDFKNKEVKQ